MAYIKMVHFLDIFRAMAISISILLVSYVMWSGALDLQLLSSSIIFCNNTSMLAI